MKKTVAILAGLCALAATVPAAAAAPATPGQTEPTPTAPVSPAGLIEVARPEMTVTYLDPTPPAPAPVEPGPTQLPATDGSGVPAASARAAALPANEDFVFEFGDSVPPERQDAIEDVFEAAGGIWSAELDVRVDIEVAVDYAPLGDDVLGGAYPVAGYAGPGLPRDDSIYPVAFANQHAGVDIAPDEADIQVVVSSDFSFYEGADGNVPVDQLSLLQLAVHEIAHGLGFSSYVFDQGGGSFVAEVDGFASIFDRRVVAANGTPITQLSPGALGSAVQSGTLYWNGPEARTINSFAPIALYAPPVFEEGSSVSHLDEAKYGSETMTPFLGRGEVTLDLSPLTVAMMRDIGWRLPGRSNNAALVTAMSVDFLNRYPNNAEITYFVNELNAGRNQRWVATRYANSDEWIGALVRSYYLVTLGREPDGPGLRSWVTQIRNGKPPATVAAQFYASDEYFNKSGGTNRAWVERLYRDILDRGPDGPGMDTWLRRLARGTGRTTIALDFYQSGESRRDRVRGLYQLLLYRNPDPTGMRTWSRRLLDGRDVALAVELASSTEYRGKARDRYAANGYG